jgi:hypothetical protein
MSNTDLVDSERPGISGPVSAAFNSPSPTGPEDAKMKLRVESLLMLNGLRGSLNLVFAMLTSIVPSLLSHKVKTTDASVAT